MFNKEEDCVCLELVKSNSKVLKNRNNLLNLITFLFFFSNSLILNMQILLRYVEFHYRLMPKAILYLTLYISLVYALIPHFVFSLTTKKLHLHTNTVSVYIMHLSPFCCYFQFCQNYSTLNVLFSYIYVYFFIQMVFFSFCIVSFFFVLAMHYYCFCFSALYVKNSTISFFPFFNFVCLLIFLCSKYFYIFSAKTALFFTTKV